MTTIRDAFIVTHVTLAEARGLYENAKQYLSEEETLDDMYEHYINCLDDETLCHHATLAAFLYVYVDDPTVSRRLQAEGLEMYDDFEQQVDYLVQHGVP